jgi:hypothetical protein
MTAREQNQIIEDFRKKTLLLGRSKGPGLLCDWFFGDELNSEQKRNLVREVILEVWSGADRPTYKLPAWLWILWFQMAGFVSEPKGMQRPAEPMMLYRGANHPTRFRRGMSWTDDLDQARWWADRLPRPSGPGVVYVAEVPPENILAINHDPDHGRGEHEFIINPKGVRTRVYERRSS